MSIDLSAAIEAAAAARFNGISKREDYEPTAWDRIPEGYREGLRLDIREAVEAAAPLIEAAVRAEIAEAIEASFRRSGSSSFLVETSYANAAMIARGEA